MRLKVLNYRYSCQLPKLNVVSSSLITRFCPLKDYFSRFKGLISKIDGRMRLTGDAYQKNSFLIATHLIFARFKELISNFGKLTFLSPHQSLMATQSLLTCSLV